MQDKQKSDHFEHEWALGFVMPNLVTRDPFEFDFENIAIVCGTDDRLREIRRTSPAANALLSGFSHDLGTGRSPSALIFRNPKGFPNLRDAMVDARNCVAVACSCFGWVQSIGHRNNFYVRDTDHFDFFPRWPSQDGKSIKYDGPALSLLTSDLTGFQGMMHNYLAATFCSQPISNVDLMLQLSKAWRRIHMTRCIKKGDRQLFRALSVAYEACRIPQAMDTPLYDHGKHCSLWISAFETLAHSNGQSGPNQVSELIGRRLLNHPKLKKRVRMKPKARLGQISSKKVFLCNTAQRLYFYLYRARNAFLHGGRLSARTFIPNCLAENVRLLDVAPLIFHTALEACFSYRPSNGTISEDSSEMWRIIRQTELENGYLRALGKDL